MIHLPDLTFDHGEDIAALLETVQQFAQADITPCGTDIDRTDQFPMDLWKKMGDLGLLGFTVDEEYGGTDMGYLAHIVAMEEISRASVSIGQARNCAKTQDAAHGPRMVADGAILHSADKATRVAIEKLGDKGYINEYPVGRLWRNATLYETGAETSEISRMLIVHDLLAETK